MSGFPCGSLVMNPPAMQEMWIGSLGQEDPLDKGMTSDSRKRVGEFHGLRNLAGYSPWGHKESDMTEQLKHIYTQKLSQICCLL